MLIDRAGIAERGQGFQQLFDEFDALHCCSAEMFGDFLGRGRGAETGQGGSDGGGSFGKFLGPRLRFGFDGLGFGRRLFGHGDGGLLFAAGVLKLRPQPAHQAAAFFFGTFVIERHQAGENVFVAQIDRPAIDLGHDGIQFVVNLPQHEDFLATLPPALNAQFSLQFFYRRTG